MPMLGAGAGAGVWCSQFASASASPAAPTWRCQISARLDNGQF
jgi:hypothetical protein